MFCHRSSKILIVEVYQTPPPTPPPFPPSTLPPPPPPKPPPPPPPECRKMELCGRIVIKASTVCCVCDCDLLVTVDRLPVYERGHIFSTLGDCASFCIAALQLWDIAVVVSRCVALYIMMMMVMIIASVIIIII